MWQPEPAWTPVSGGRGPCTVGVWRSSDGYIVKRVRTPSEDESADLLRVDSPVYWRREAEMALAGYPMHGLIAPEVRRLDEDDEGYTLWVRTYDQAPVEPGRVAQALGEFTGSEINPARWHARGYLRAKVAQAESHDGWPTLARTTVADLSEAFWSCRGGLLARLEAMPQVPSHGDLVTGNVLAIEHDRVVVADWGSFGWAAAGEDLGMWVLSANGDLEILVRQYAAGREIAADDVLWAAQLVIAFTALSRAEWALSRVAPGEGALANKYRHPAIAPYLRALQRQLPTIEALVASG